jgi:hypothetical protein
LNTTFSLRYPQIHVENYPVIISCAHSHPLNRRKIAENHRKVAKKLLQNRRKIAEKIAKNHLQIGQNKANISKSLKNNPKIRNKNRRLFLIFTRTRFTLYASRFHDFTLYAIRMLRGLRFTLYAFVNFTLYALRIDFFPIRAQACKNRNRKK